MRNAFANALIWLCALSWSCASAAEVKNENLCVSAKDGDGAVVLKSAGGASVEIAVLAAGEKAVKFDKVKVSGETMVVSGGGVEASFVLEPVARAVQVKPGKGTVSVDVRTKAKFAVLPDFFADDVIYDPVQFTGDRIPVPAENFLLQFPGGGNAIVMCIWPGPGKTAGGVANASTAENQDEQKVDLLLAGRGPERVVSAGRIEFAGRPVFVGIVENKGLWHVENVRSWLGQKPGTIGWKRPFEAKWRGDFIVADGEATADWQSKSQSFPFEGSYRRNETIERGTVDAPLKWIASIKQFIYPCWFVEDETRLCMYSDLKERNKALNINESEKYAAKQSAKDGKVHTPKPEVFPTNIYEKVLIYALDRATNTPLAVFTPVDVMRATLGQGPCEYVLDLEGVKPSPAGGKRELLAGATCPLWMDHVFYVMCKMKKRADGTYEPLEPKLKERLLQALDDMRTFVHAVHDRLRGYREFGREMEKFCEEEAKRTPKVKPVAEKVLTITRTMNKDVAQIKLDGPDAGDNKWDKEIQTIIDAAKEERYDSVGKAGAIRDLGDYQDNMMSRCRRYVKGIRHEVSLIDASDDEIRRFATAVRERSHSILRNKHPMEGI